MAIPSIVQRQNETGDSFRTFTSSGVHTQGVSLVDDNGDQQGVTGNPLLVSEVSAGTITRIDSGGTAVASALLHNGAVSLSAIRGTLLPTVTSDRYLMLFDAGALPVSNGTVPDWIVPIPAGGHAGDDWQLPIPFTSGIVAAISSTANTLTIVGAGEAMIKGLKVV